MDACKECKTLYAIEFSIHQDYCDSCYEKIEPSKVRKCLACNGTGIHNRDGFCYFCNGTGRKKV